MDHAEVIQRLEAAAVSRGGLARLATDGSDVSVAMRAHLAACASCLAEAQALRLSALALDAVASDDLHPPPDARDRLLAAVRTTAVPRSATDVVPAVPAADRTSEPAAASAPGSPFAGGTSGRRPLPQRGAPRPAWIALAAAAAVLVFVLGAALGGPLGLAPVPDERPDAVGRVAAAVDRVLRAPDHRVVELRDPGGRPAGSVLWDPDAKELVVVSRALPPSPPGSEYHCFIERDGERMWVGEMRETDGAAWWVGPVTEPTGAGAPGDRFIVVAGDDGPAVLSGGF